LDVHVTAAKPLALEARPRRLGATPVPGRGRVPGDPQLARRPGPNRIPLVVREADAVAADDRARRAGTAAARPVRDVDVRHLRRPDPVEDLDAETLAEAREQLGRQRLAGGNAVPHGVKRVL